MKKKMNKNLIWFYFALCALVLTGFFTSCGEDSVISNGKLSFENIPDDQVQEVKKVDCYFTGFGLLADTIVKKSIELTQPMNMEGLFDIKTTSGEELNDNKVAYKTISSVKLFYVKRTNRYIGSIDDLQKPTIEPNKAGEGWIVKTGAVNDLVTIDNFTEELVVKGKRFSEMCQNNTASFTVSYSDISFDRDSLSNFKGHNATATYTFKVEDSDSNGINTWVYRFPVWFWVCLDGNVPEDIPGDDDVIGTIVAEEIQDELKRDTSSVADGKKYELISNINGWLKLIKKMIPSNTEEKFKVERKNIMSYLSFPDTIGTVNLKEGENFTFEETKSSRSEMVDRKANIYLYLDQIRVQGETRYDSIMYGKHILNLNYFYDEVVATPSGSYEKDNVYYVHCYGHHTFDTRAQEFWLKIKINRGGSGTDEKLKDWNLISILPTDDGQWDHYINCEYPSGNVKKHIFAPMDFIFNGEKLIEKTIPGTEPKLTLSNKTISDLKWNQVQGKDYTWTSVGEFNYNDGIVNKLNLQMNRGAVLEIEGISHAIPADQYPAVSLKNYDIVPNGNIYIENKAKVQNFKSYYHAVCKNVNIGNLVQDFKISVEEKNVSSEPVVENIVIHTDGTWECDVIQKNTVDENKTQHYSNLPLAALLTVTPEKTAKSAHAVLDLFLKTVNMGTWGFEKNASGSDYKAQTVKSTNSVVFNQYTELEALLTLNRNFQLLFNGQWIPVTLPEPVITATPVKGDYDDTTAKTTQKYNVTYNVTLMGTNICTASQLATIEYEKPESFTYTILTDAIGVDANQYYRLLEVRKTSSKGTSEDLSLNRSMNLKITDNGPITIDGLELVFPATPGFPSMTPGVVGSFDQDGWKGSSHTYNFAQNFFAFTTDVAITIDDETSYQGNQLKRGNPSITKIEIVETGTNSDLDYDYKYSDIIYTVSVDGEIVTHIQKLIQRKLKPVDPTIPGYHIIYEGLACLSDQYTDNRTSYDVTRINALFADDNNENNIIHVTFDENGVEIAGSRETVTKEQIAAVPAGGYCSQVWNGSAYRAAIMSGNIVKDNYKNGWQYKSYDGASVAGVSKASVSLHTLRFPLRDTGTWNSERGFLQIGNVRLK